MNRRTKTIRIFVRLLVSGSLLAGLFLVGGLEEFKDMAQRMRWAMLVPFVALTALLVLLFAYRWWLLLGSTVTFRRAFATTLVGLGANMVLPARGGDLLRAYHSAHHPGAGVHLVVARLFLEKLLDLGTVLLVGTAALVLLGVHEKHRGVVLAAMLIAAAMLVLLVLVRMRSEWLASTTRAFLSKVRLGRIYDRHLHRLLQELSEGVGWQELAGPLLISLALWLTAYAGAYMACSEMVGVQLTYLEALVLLLAASAGLAIPAAPSGLGTFHAAVASGFVLLGRPLSEGVLVAIAIHGCFFVILLVPAAAVYALGLVDRGASPAREETR
jgi:uncharacterized protein (TIRG00374 family)